MTDRLPTKAEAEVLAYLGRYTVDAGVGSEKFDAAAVAACRRAKWVDLHGFPNTPARGCVHIEGAGREALARAKEAGIID